jgi:hypothetical protein
MADTSTGLMSFQILGTIAAFEPATPTDPGNRNRTSAFEEREPSHQ